ncbi:hypothetical protein PF003_g24095 [Phytophthora fragariae]|nr:hypothetical protein PF003_g24095 [Phytophthora fragariae]
MITLTIADPIILVVNEVPCIARAARFVILDVVWRSCIKQQRVKKTGSFVRFFILAR